MKADDDGAASPYEGHGVLSFDPKLGKLVGVWVDSKTTWLATAEGSLGDGGRTLTLNVERRHPVTGEVMMQRFVTTRTSDDTRRLEIFFPAPGGDYMRVAKFDYTRREPTAEK